MTESGIPNPIFLFRMAGSDVNGILSNKKFQS